MAKATKPYQSIWVGIIRMVAFNTTPRTTVLTFRLAFYLAHFNEIASSVTGIITDALLGRVESVR